MAQRIGVVQHATSCSPMTHAVGGQLERPPRAVRRPSCGAAACRAPQAGCLRGRTAGPRPRSPSRRAPPSPPPSPKADERSTTPCRFTTTPRRWAPSLEGGPVNTTPASGCEAPSVDAVRAARLSISTHSSRPARRRSSMCARSSGTPAASLSTMREELAAEGDVHRHAPPRAARRCRPCGRRPARVRQRPPARRPAARTRDRTRPWRVSKIKQLIRLVAAVAGQDQPARHAHRRPRPPPRRRRQRG